ncbi:MAG: MBL fold metallo-hydrolase [Cyanobacteria bacterium K_DeepCast_35m_m2_023]|nr:MBL fold metallo-hydrolase [Cyanobacteria bacterium K_DeepCast_35m_m2_023]
MGASKADVLAAAAGATPLLFRQLFDAETGTYSYLLADVASRQGLLIDPVYEQHGRDLALVQELGITVVASLDTHAHADHVTGSWLMQQATGCAIGLAAAVRADNVSLPLHHGNQIPFGARFLSVRATPGHTDGCLTYVLDDQSLAFTGDALLVRGCGRCDFQQGDAHTLYRSITEQILSLPANCQLYPGHDYTGRGMSSVMEEQLYNTRLGGLANERDFVGFMQNMKLPHPHRIAEALPANLRSGQPRDQQLPAPAWAPLQRSFAGLPELAPSWVAAHCSELTLLDVRSHDESSGPDGHIPGSLLIPLPELDQRLDEIPRHRPVVVLCHSGSRSALATQQLQKAGVEQVANLRGGLRRWADEGYPLEGAINA